MSARAQRSSSRPVGVGTPYRNILGLVQDRERMELLADALDISRRNVQRDECGQWTIQGKRGGLLQTFDDVLYLLYVQNGSSRKWGWTKRKAEALGIEITQDGDDEGCFRLELPNRLQSAFIRNTLHLRKKPERPSNENANNQGVSAL
jgi:hypothetical protein